MRRGGVRPPPRADDPVAPMMTTPLTLLATSRSVSATVAIVDSSPLASSECSVCDRAVASLIAPFLLLDQSGHHVDVTASLIRQPLCTLGRGRLIAYGDPPAMRFAAASNGITTECGVGDAHHLPRGHRPSQMPCTDSSRSNGGYPDAGGRSADRLRGPPVPTVAPIASQSLASRVSTLDAAAGRRAAGMRMTPRRRIGITPNTHAAARALLYGDRGATRQQRKARRRSYHPA